MSAVDQAYGAAGYSPGPSRQLPMRYAEAEDTFATARFPDRGKPLPGEQVRLWEEDNGDFYVTYHDSPVVTIHPDGTYTLDTNGYYTRMTKIRMQEYAPAQIFELGKREYRSIRRWSEPFLGYDNFAVTFDCPISVAAQRESLYHSWFPERFEWKCVLEWPRESLHVDADGRPVLSSLFAQLAPEEWKNTVGKRLQPWARAQALPGQRAPIPPRRHAAAYTKVWPGEGHQTQLLMLRRAWIGNTPIASVWSNQIPYGPTTYRWLVMGELGRPLVDHGEASDLELALQDVDRAISATGWSQAPPPLKAVLGNLRTQLGPDAPGQLGLPFQRGPALLDKAVLRVHWMEPWSTKEWVQQPGQYHSTAGRTLPRMQMPGSEPWPGPEKVRVWFELVDGTGVGIVHDPQTKTDTVVLTALSPEARTQWEIPGVLAVGLVGAVGALLTGFWKL